jgi:hypothetical protein
MHGLMIAVSTLSLIAVYFLMNVSSISSISGKTAMILTVF